MLSTPHRLEFSSNNTQIIVIGSKRFRFKSKTGKPYAPITQGLFCTQPLMIQLSSRRTSNSSKLPEAAVLDCKKCNETSEAVFANYMNVSSLSRPKRVFFFGFITAFVIME